LRKESPAGSRKVRAAILSTFETIATLPHSGRAQQTEGVRKLGLSRYPYLVYFKVDEKAQAVLILSVQHAARERQYRDL
jgi:toxin ParE1/3/4